MSENIPMFVSLREGLKSIGKLIPVTEDIYKHINNPNTDWYSSLYQYTQEQKDLVEIKGSFSGIRETVTNRLFFDLDDEKNLPKAKADALSLALKLVNMGVPEEALKVHFSGKKGFSLEFNIKQKLTPEQFTKLLFEFHQSFETLDLSVRDPNRIVRIPNTKHHVSGLYKIPLTLVELEELAIEDILVLAKQPRLDLSFPNVVADLPKELLDLTTIIEKPKSNYSLIPTNNGINWAQKPHHWKNCKWSLLQGHFEHGTHHNALLVLIATCRGIGYDQETAYYMGLSAIKKQAQIHGEGTFEEEELQKIVESIYSPNWVGGQYSCKTQGWLQSYCDKLGEHTCSDRNDSQLDCVSMGNVWDEFTNYANTFETNLVKTGLPDLDAHLLLLSSTLVGLLGRPGAGKTALSLKILQQASQAGINSIFLSLDMAAPLIAAKLIQTEKKIDFMKAVEFTRKHPDEALKIKQKYEKKYSRVSMNFKPSMTIEDIKNLILKRQQEIGDKVKFVVVDYLECLVSSHQDPTVNVGINAAKLSALAKELNVCVLLLLQTQKHSTTAISDPLTSLSNVKGSSVIEQSCSAVFSLWREGYSPDTYVDDKSISMAILKNRFGALWKGDFAWNGITSEIRTMTMEEEDALETLRRAKKAKKAKQESAGWS